MIPQTTSKQISDLRSKSGILSRQKSKNTPKTGFVASRIRTCVDYENAILAKSAVKSRHAYQFFGLSAGGVSPSFAGGGVASFGIGNGIVNV